jgi:DNA repair protein RadC
MTCAEEPPHRLEAQGAAALSDSELLSLVLHYGMKSEESLALARQLLLQAGDLTRLATWHLADFMRLPGVGRSKAQLLIALVEISRRIFRGSTDIHPVLDCANAIALHMAPIALGLEVEKFWVLCLDRKGRLKKLCEVSSGTQSSTLVHPREVFRAAIREAASAVVCVHNHPSGDPSPSAQDIRITRSLRDAAATVDIALLDHMIVGRREVDPHGVGHHSFRGSGAL